MPTSSLLFYWCSPGMTGRAQKLQRKHARTPHPEGHEPPWSWTVQVWEPGRVEPVIQRASPSGPDCILSSEAACGQREQHSQCGCSLPPVSQTTSARAAHHALPAIGRAVLEAGPSHSYSLHNATTVFAQTANRFLSATQATFSSIGRGSDPRPLSEVLAIRGCPASSVKDQ